jgi:thioredoxin 1
MKLQELQKKSEGNLLMVDFYADWCSPCKTLGPIIEKVSAETDTELLKIDAVENKELASELSVRGIPAVIFFKNGVEIERVVGLNPEKKYLEIIDSNK